MLYVKSHVEETSELVNVNTDIERKCFTKHLNLVIMLTEVSKVKLR